MGYYKNQLIAEQVEVGDRVPQPKPASSHVAFPSRRLTRQAQSGRRYMTVSTGRYQATVAGMTLAGIVVGLIVGWSL